jgi:hypothetical protein
LIGNAEEESTMNNTIEATVENGYLPAHAGDERTLLLLLAALDARDIQTRAQEDAAIDAEDILTQAEEASGLA